MALDALWAVLLPQVSQVSGVQANIHAGFADTPALWLEVSQVSDKHRREAGAVLVGGSATPDTSPENQRYQAKPNIHAGCTLDTADTCKAITTEVHIADCLLNGYLSTAPAGEPKVAIRQRGPWLTDRQAACAKAYHLHHFNCVQCTAAGRGQRYAERCAVGLSLWHAYTQADTTSDSQTEGVQHGQA